MPEGTQGAVSSGFLTPANGANNPLLIVTVHSVHSNRCTQNGQGQPILARDSLGFVTQKTRENTSRWHL